MLDTTRSHIILPQEVTNYTNRIGAERKSCRKFGVPDEGATGRYTKYKAMIWINADGTVRCEDEAFAPTDEERDAIKAVAASLPRSVPATRWDYDQLLASGKIIGKAYPIYDSAREKILTVEERREREDRQKYYVPWTLYAVPGSGLAPVWDMGQVDGAQPFWLPWRFKKHGELLSINQPAFMVHEGAKVAAFVDALVNDPEMREERKKHPWIEELSCYEHIGTIGGAPSTRYMDFEWLRRAGKPCRPVYVCDNDDEGRDAVRAFSRGYGRGIDMITFDERFPVAFDLADPLPDKIKCRLEELREPATWATRPKKKKKTEDGEQQQGRPAHVLTSDFKKEWYHTVRPELFIHVWWSRRLMFTADEFDHYVARFSDIKRVSELVKKDAKQAETINYRPDLKPGYHNADENRLGKTFINIYRAAWLRDYDPGEEPDIAPIEEYFRLVYPVERDRIELMRWAATLILKPDVKIKYGVLLYSETQGVGKTTFAEMLEKALGSDNVDYPSEKSILSRFSTYKKHRLIVISEIYSGHSRKVYDETKDLITDRILDVEEKFQLPYAIENFCHVIGCSNYSRAVKLDDKDRRWFAPKVTEQKQSEEYWIKYKAYLDDEGGRKMKYWAKKVAERHGLVGNATEAPRTDAKTDIIKAQYSNGQQMIENVFTHILNIYDHFKDRDQWDAATKTAKTAEVEKAYTVSAYSHTNEMKKVVEHASKGEHFVMFDVHGKMAIEAMYNRDQYIDKQKDKAVRVVAKNAGFYIGEKRCGFYWDGKKETKGALVISLDRELAAADPSDLRDRDNPKVPWINLHTLANELRTM